MTLLNQPATFGSGGSEPYARALRANRPLRLVLLDDDIDDVETEQLMDVERWNAKADDADLTLLRSSTGPVLDIGCGPGRMVRAAMDLGMVVLGIDVSPTAIDIARGDGLSVLERSVFERLPGEGSWQTVLLVDGNIGIGGDVRGMLARCEQILAPGGEMVIEVHPDTRTHRTYTARVFADNGGASEEFPWAEIGLDALVSVAIEQQLEVRQSWRMGSRTFVRLATAR